MASEVLLQESPDLGLGRETKGVRGDLPNRTADIGSTCVQLYRDMLKNAPEKECFGLTNTVPHASQAPRGGALGDLMGGHSWCSLIAAPAPEEVRPGAGVGVPAKGSLCTVALSWGWF